jgi:hypothetical protein
VSLEKSYNGGNVNRYVSDASENKEKNISMKTKMDGTHYTAYSGGREQTKKTLKTGEIKCKLASLNNKKTQVQVLGISRKVRSIASRDVAETTSRRDKSVCPRSSQIPLEHKTLYRRLG